MTQSVTPQSLNASASATRPDHGEGLTPSRRRGKTLLAALAWAFGATRAFVVMAAGFVATPYLLRYLGAERLGAFRASQQWAASLILLNFALTWALGIWVLRALNESDLKRASALVKASFRLEARQMLLVVAPVAAVMAWFMPDLVPVSAPLRAEFRLGAMLSLVGLVLWPFDAFRCLLDSLQLTSLVELATMIQGLLTTGFAVLLAWGGYGLPGQYVALVVGAAVFAMLVARWGIGHLPGFWEVRAAEVSAKELWRVRGPLTALGVGTTINLMTDYIVVGILFAPASVTTFSITQRLVTVLGGLSASFGTVAWAGLGETLLRDGKERFEARVLELVRLTAGLGIIVCGTLAAYNFRFVRLWVGPQYYGGVLLTASTAAQTVIGGLVAVFLFVIDTQGNATSRMWLSLPGALLNLVLSVVLGRWLGLWGVSLATVIAYGLGDFWYGPYLFARLYGVSMGRMVATLLRVVALCAPWTLLVWYIAQVSGPLPGWPRFIAEFCLANVAGLIYFALVVMTREDRAGWRFRLDAQMARLGIPRW